MFSARLLRYVKKMTVLSEQEGLFMSIIVNLDVVMAKRKISSGELAEKLEITPANLSILKTGKAKAIRFTTLDKLCQVLECKPGDILDYEEDGESE